MGKKLMVLAGLVAALFMASNALAGVPCPGCDEFADDFTIQAVAKSTCELDGFTYYEVEIAIDNQTGFTLENFKIQGGTAAWVTWVPFDAAVGCVKSSEGVFQRWPLPKSNKGKAPKNKNVILGYNGLASLPSGNAEPTTFSVVVKSDKTFECPGSSPNVIGGWSASARYFDEDLQEYVEVKAQALDKDNNFLWERCPTGNENPDLGPVDPFSEDNCVEEDDTPEVFVCDFFASA